MPAEVFIDGKMFPVLWGAVQRSRRPDGLPRHSAMPLTVMTVNNVYIEWHPRLGVYDFSVLDRLAEQYIAEFGKLAKENNTMILPADLSNIASVVKTAAAAFDNRRD